MPSDPAERTQSEPSEAQARPAGRALTRSAGALLAAQAVSTALAIVLSGALGRTLGPAEFGLYFLVHSMGAFAYVIAEWGQYQFIVRDLAKTPARSADLLAAALAFRAGAAFVLAGLTAALAVLLGYPARTAAYAGLIVVAMLPFFLAQAHNLVFRARERMEREAIAIVADKALTLGLALLFLALGWGLAGMLLALALGGLGSLVVAAVLTRRLGVRHVLPRWAAVVEIVKGGASLALLNAEASAQTEIDPIVLSRLAPAPALGWFGAARSITGTLIAPAIVLEIASYPRLSRTADDRPRFRQELRSVLRGTIALAALALVGTWLFADAAVGLVFGKQDYAEAGRILAWSAPVLFLFFIDNILASAAIASRRSAAIVVAKVVNIVAGAGLAFLLVPRFEAARGNGALGMVVSGGLAELVIMATALTVLPEGSLDPLLLLDVAKALLAAGGTLALFEVLPHLPLLPGMVACVAAFAAIGFAVKLVTPGELRSLLPARGG